MKKSVIIALFLIALVLILVVIGMCVYFFFLRPSAPAQETDTPLLSVEAYAAECWPDYSAQYSGNTLVLTKKTSMTYAEAYEVAGNIYTDELAPETYVSVAQTIAIDIAASCGVAPTVVLRYTSTDGETVFSVSSLGDIVTCWERGGAQ